MKGYCKLKVGQFWLSPRERQIVRMRLGLNYSTDPMTYEAIGKKFGVNRERIRQLLWKAMQKLKLNDLI